MRSSSLEWHQIPCCSFLINTKPDDQNCNKNQTQKWSAELKNFNDETQKGGGGNWCLLLLNCFVSTVLGPFIDSGAVASKSLLFFPAALVSEPKWLKQDCEFITSGQCNYLGSGQVTEINMTQSAPPLTLIHDKVCWCLSIERTGLLDFVSLQLFWFTVGSLHHYKRAIVLQDGEVMNRLLKSHLWPEQLPLLAHLDTTHSQLGWKGSGSDLYSPHTWCIVCVWSFSFFPAGGPSELGATMETSWFQEEVSVLTSARQTGALEHLTQPTSSLLKHHPHQVNSKQLVAHCNSIKNKYVTR